MTPLCRLKPRTILLVNKINVMGTRKLMMDCRHMARPVQLIVFTSIIFKLNKHDEDMYTNFFESSKVLLRPAIIKICSLDPSSAK